MTVTTWQLGARRLGGGLLAAALVLGASVGIGTPAATAASTQVSASGMVGDVNQARDARGLRALSTDGSLASVALAQAKRMASRGTLYHNPNLAKDVSNYRWVGENVGYGPSLTAVQSAFMRSPTHKANIVDRSYTQVGIAAVRDDKGRTWVAQVFRQPKSSSSATKPRKTRQTTSSKPAKAKVRSRSSKADAKASGVGTARDDSPATPAPAAPRSTPAPAPTVQTPAPASTPTLDERILTATRAAAPGSDPVADALAYAQVMRAVGA